MVLSSASNLKFVASCSTLYSNFRFDKGTSKIMILVWFTDLKFL